MYNGLTFKELSEKWCDVKRPIVKHSTMCAYALALQTHILPEFSTSTTISESDVQLFVIRKCSSGLAKKTVRDVVAVLKSVVKYGGKHNLFPYEEWDIQYPTEKHFRHLPVLPICHQKRLMNYLTENPNRKNIGVLLALCTGMRIGEICALRWNDVDLEQRIITVRETVSRVYNCKIKKTERIQSSPKTENAYREIPICRQLLRSLKMVQKEADTPFVVGVSERSQEPRSYRDYYNRLLKRLDIGHVVFHGLRHTFATRCVESQCDYKTLSVILGHSNVATTMNLYVHPNLDQKKRCIERMSKLFECSYETQ